MNKRRDEGIRRNETRSLDHYVEYLEEHGFTPDQQGPRLASNATKQSVVGDRQGMPSLLSGGIVLSQMHTAKPTRVANIYDHVGTDFTHGHHDPLPDTNDSKEPLDDLPEDFGQSGSDPYSDLDDSCDCGENATHVGADGHPACDECDPREHPHHKNFGHDVDDIGGTNGMEEDLHLDGMMGLASKNKRRPLTVSESLASNPRRTMKACGKKFIRVSEDKE